jgi:hypothetical protein
MFIHLVPEHAEVVSIDGVAYAREIFKFFGEAANAGSIFQFVSKDEDGTVTLKTLMPAEQGN